MTELGPFSLQQPLARGGFGAVYVGRHAGGAPVAIKLVPALDPRTRRAFRREIRAVARLRHPGVVVVLDHGELEQPVDALPPGSPWLAMELGEGTLEHAPPHTWEGLRDALRRILDALAHAHARQVVHLDVKPANVLRIGDRWVLTDFGLAHALDAGDEQSAGGTPAYMAPEQWKRAWRDFGPWTDLYAVGCMAWQLASGVLPFQTSVSVSELRVRHLTREPSAFEPRFPVPEGFEVWVRTCMAKLAAERYASAAEAALALLAVDRTPMVDGTGAPGVSSTSSTVLTFDLFDDLDAALDRVPIVREPTGARLPIPADWSRPEQRPHAVHLAGAGLSLFGLREIPLVDREPQRDRLWASLRAVETGEAPGIVVLRGGPGVGKSRLARWFCRRVRELGVATPVEVVHSNPVGPADGPAAAIESLLRCQGLDRAAVQARIGSRYPREDPAFVAELVELIRPDPSTPREQRLIAPEDRVPVAARFLAHLARTRPVVLWIDDAQWGPESMALGRHCVARGLDVLVVATVRADLPSEATAELEAAADSVQDVGPLGAEDRVALVQELLGLSGELARQVARRSGGNPLFSVQLVGDWVQREVLVPGAGGRFELAPGAEPGLPDALHDLWVGRLRDVLSRAAPEARIALERAAVLGKEVDRDEWSEACAAAGLPSDGPWFSELERRGLVEDQGESFTFVHGLLVESLVRLSREAGRHEAHRAACYAVLDARAEALRLRGLGGRAMAQQLRARDLARGEEVLHQNSHIGDAYRMVGRMKEARAAQERVLEAAPPGSAIRARALNRMGIVHQFLGDEDAAIAHFRRSIEAWEDAGQRDRQVSPATNLANLLQAKGDLEGCMRWVRHALSIVEGSDDGLTEGKVRANYGEMLAAAQQPEEAERQLDRAIELSSAHGDQRNVGYAQGAKARLMHYLGRWDEARELYGRAIELHRACDHLHSLTHDLGALGLLYAEMGELDAARSTTLDALEIARQTGNRSAVGNQLNRLAVLCNTRGEFEAAADWCRQAIAIHRASSNEHDLTVGLGNLAEALFALGRLDEARQAVIEAIEVAARTRYTVAEGVFAGTRAEIEEALGHPDEADRLLDRADSLLEQAGQLIQVGMGELVRGRIRASRGELEGARTHVERAEAVAAELGVQETSDLARKIAALRARLDPP